MPAAAGDLVDCVFAVIEGAEREALVFGEFVQAVFGESVARARLVRRFSAALRAALLDWVVGEVLVALGEAAGLHECVGEGGYNRVMSGPIMTCAKKPLVGLQLVGMGVAMGLFMLAFGLDERPLQLIPAAVLIVLGLWDWAKPRRKR